MSYFQVEQLPENKTSEYLIWSLFANDWIYKPTESHTYYPTSHTILNIITILGLLNESIIFKGNDCHLWSVIIRVYEQSVYFWAPDRLLHPPFRSALMCLVSVTWVKQKNCYRYVKKGDRMWPFQGSQ